MFARMYMTYWCLILKSIVNLTISWKNGLPLFVTKYRITIVFASQTDIDKLASFNFSLHFYDFYPLLCRFTILLLYIRWLFKLTCMPNTKSFHTFFIFDYLRKYKMSRTDIFHRHGRTLKANRKGNFKIHELFFN